LTVTVADARMLANDKSQHNCIYYVIYIKSQPDSDIPTIPGTGSEAAADGGLFRATARVNSQSVPLGEYR